MTKTPEVKKYVNRKKLFWLVIKNKVKYLFKIPIFVIIRKNSLLRFSLKTSFYNAPYFYLKRRLNRLNKLVGSKFESVVLGKFDRKILDQILTILN